MILKLIAVVVAVLIMVWGIYFSLLPVQIASETVIDNLTIYTVSHYFLLSRVLGGSGWAFLLAVSIFHIGYKNCPTGIEKWTVAPAYVGVTVGVIFYLLF